MFLHEMQLVGSAQAKNGDDSHVLFGMVALKDGGGCFAWHNRLEIVTCSLQHKHSEP